MNMVGMATKKYAQDNNLTVKNGVAYGSFGGYTITLNDGSGWRTVTFAAQFDVSEKVDAISAMLGDKAFKKQYKIGGFAFAPYGVTINFANNTSQFKRITEFLDAFTQKLSSLGIRGDVCAHCGQPFDTACAVPVLLNDVVFNMHEGCIDRANEENALKKEEAKTSGSVLTGVFGAILGGLVGSIPWAIASYLGWFVGWLGFLIGIAAKKGYEILKGKETRAKGIIVVAVTVVCVIIAELLTSIIGVYIGFSNDPEMASYGLSFTDVAVWFLNLTVFEPEVRNSVLANLGLGLLFMSLGIYSTARDMFRKTGKKSGVAIRLD